MNRQLIDGSDESILVPDKFYKGRSEVIGHLAPSTCLYRFARGAGDFVKAAEGCYKYVFRLVLTCKHTQFKIAST
jgi:hypothetical protein